MIVTVCFITDGVYLDHLAKVVSARFLYYKDTIFTIVANKYLRRDNLKQCKHLLPQTFATNLGMHSWI